MSEGYEKQAPLTGFDGLTDYRRPNSSPTTFRLTIDHTVQHLPALLPLTPPKLHLFANKEPSGMAEDRFSVPRTKYGAQGSSGSVCGGSYPPPLKLHLFCNKEPFSLAEDKIAVPRKNHGTHSSSGSAWRIPYAERMQYLHVISYDTPGRKKRWSQERMTGRRKMGPTTSTSKYMAQQRARPVILKLQAGIPGRGEKEEKYIKKQRRGEIFSIVELDTK